MLTLIGTVHLDIDACHVLYNLLDRLKPSCIAVEVSCFSVAYRRKHQQRWLEKLNTIKKRLPEDKKGHFRIELLYRQLQMPFEWETAYKFAHIAGIPCIAIDCGEISRKELPGWDKELITESNLLLATAEPDQHINEYFSRHYRQALFYLANRDRPKDKFIKSVFDNQWYKREKILGKRLLSLSLKYHKVVYVGGWMHLIEGRNIFNLANIVKMAVKERFLLTGKIVHKL